MPAPARIAYDLQGPPVTHSTIEETTSPPDRLIVSVADMAAMLGIGRRTAYELLDAGHMECRYIGRRRFVTVASIEAFVASLPTERN